MCHSAQSRRGGATVLLATAGIYHRRFKNRQIKIKKAPVFLPEPWCIPASRWRMAA
ncbi:protein of unknown function [Paraburkholderia dioscoreae]|uniref:Uncharacterized protein n=1 Tax=Paraburkholderia dioscoreae TaxID=2604047 RepID=A0A5Q4ZIP2_9BURK|nr:protein of unknown function [Paraburkholderia dioscoreae]